MVASSHQNHYVLLKVHLPYCEFLVVQHYKIETSTLTSESAALLSAPSDDAWLLHLGDWPTPSGEPASSPPLSSHSEFENSQVSDHTQTMESKILIKNKNKQKKKYGKTTTYMQNTIVLQLWMSREEKKETKKNKTNNSQK